MSGRHDADGARFLDEGQYTRAAIADYEAIYGRGFVSPGGRESALACIAALAPAPGERVLDVGCGLAGSAVLMARERGARVHAIDLSRNMVALARERVREAGVEALVEVEHADCLELAGEALYAGVYSRDVFLHVADKPRLLATLHRLLVPGGRLVFTDYCAGPPPWSEEFAGYAAARDYDLRTVDAWAALLAAAGFESVHAEDRTSEFVAIHRAELARLPTLGLASAAAAEHAEGWRAKIRRALAGEQRWGFFSAVKA